MGSRIRFRCDQRWKKQLHINSNMHVNIDTLDKINMTDYEEITIKVKLISDLNWIGEKGQSFFKSQMFL